MIYSTFDLYSLCREQVNATLTDPTHMKASRDDALFAILDTVKQKCETDYPQVENHMISSTFWDLCRECVQTNVLEHRIR